MKAIVEKILSHPKIQAILRLSAHLNDCSLSAHSGQTAFFFMLSFFPFMLFLFAVLRLTPLTEDIFSSFLLYIIPDIFDNFLEGLIHNIYAASSGQVLSLSVISAIWLGSKSFLSLVQGLNSMYCKKESRNYIVLRIFAAIYSVFFALLLIATLAFLVFGNWIHDLIISKFPFVASVSSQIVSFRMLIGFMILFAIFLLMYHFLPNCKWKLRWHLPGAFLATLGWLLFSWLYSYYVNYFNNYSSFYGTMTTIALLMVWLYACMYILFLGGVLNDCLKRYRTTGRIGTAD